MVLLDFFFTGRLAEYLHPQFRPLTPVAGGILCVMGVIYAAAKPGRRCCVEEGCVHENALGQRPLRGVMAMLILFTPLAAGVAFSTDSYDQKAVLNRGFVQNIATLPARTNSREREGQANQLIPPDALGADGDEAASEPLPQNDPQAATNDCSRSDAGPGEANPASSSDDGSERYLPKAADGNLSLEVTDLLSAEQEESLQKTFAGKTVEVIGQYLPGADSNQFKLVRMFIVCCAADARPIALSVHTAGKIPVSEMQWIRVTGKPVFTRNGNRTQVGMNAVQITSIDPPAEAMLY